MSPAFDLHVTRGGYAWWYLDALSDDGRHGLTLIAFIGSVFSPYYAQARRRGSADALDHCALNVALYAQPGTGSATGWTMTERGADAVRRGPSVLRIGPSQLTWSDGILTIQIEEVTVPWPSRVRGTVRLRPAALMNTRYPLDAAGRHLWCPIAPCARVEVDLSHPALRWEGAGYLDCNAGERPLEQDFARWDWSRAALPGQRAAVLYDVERSDGSAMALALQFDGTGQVRQVDPPPRAPLPPTGWRLARATRCDRVFAPRVVQTLEDAPFYARSLLRTCMFGEEVAAVHESLSLHRWAARAVQLMLPFRMPRLAGRARPRPAGRVTP
ncbi:carotenoid 1,2-hydratase [Ramlibacter sp.]|uniref:carotenoid 1,2-hydratase n=1 Tax=Ramlibacter sp. TaxID=1917967 RepID=UPI003D0FF4AF